MFEEGACHSHARAERQLSTIWPHHLMQNAHSSQGSWNFAQFLLCAAALFGTIVSHLDEIAQKRSGRSNVQVGRSNNTTKEVVMLTSIRGLTAASLSAGLLLSAAPAFAPE
ncbi:MAG: hypothetical protein AAGK01_05550, partial [Pseudomonadota bacterium]